MTGKRRDQCCIRPLSQIPDQTSDPNFAQDIQIIGYQNARHPDLVVVGGIPVAAMGIDVLLGAVSGAAADARCRETVAIEQETAHAERLVRHEQVQEQRPRQRCV